MFKRIAQKATAFGAAAVATYAVLSSVVLLAAPASEQSQVATTSTPMQVVVIEAKRMPKL
jgi:hypothetical protein